MCWWVRRARVLVATVVVAMVCVCGNGSVCGDMECIAGRRHTDSGGNGIDGIRHRIPAAVAVGTFPLTSSLLIQSCTRGPTHRGKATSDRDDQITPADVTIALAFAAGGGSAPCDHTTPGHTSMLVATTASPPLMRS